MRGIIRACKTRFGLLFVFLVRILRRRLAHPLDDARIFDCRNGLLDAFHLDLMKPVVAEVEPVSEDAPRIEAQAVERCGASVAISSRPRRRIGQPVIGPLGIEGSFAELNSTQVHQR